MSNVSKVEGKKRGRPPGSKNRNRPSKLSSRPDRIKTKVDDSIEATIRHLLDLPTNTETKIKLIKASLE